MAGSGYPGVAQLVARLLWEQDAGSSSLPTRTIVENCRFMSTVLFFVGFFETPIIPFRPLSRAAVLLK